MGKARVGGLALLGQNLPQPLPELGRGGAATEAKQRSLPGQALSFPTHTSLSPIIWGRVVRGSNEPQLFKG